MSNRDVWEPAVRPFFDAAMASIRVTAAVSWGKGERFWNAAGEVKPFENDAEVGLEGRLNQQLQTYPDPFHEMDIKYAKPKDTSRNTYVLVTEVASQETRTLDDPFGGPWWSSSQSWVFQVWGQEQEYVDTWLINSWAVRHMVEMFPGIRALLAE